MFNMKNFHRAAFISIPVILLIALVYMSGGSTSEATISAIQTPGSSIAGFGFFEEQIFLIAMMFLLGLMTMSSFAENRKNA